jgi:hypothetical protein
MRARAEARWPISHTAETRATGMPYSAIRTGASVARGASAPWAALRWHIPAYHEAHSAGVFAPTVGANHNAYRGPHQACTEAEEATYRSRIDILTGSEHPSSEPNPP